MMIALAPYSSGVSVVLIAAAIYYVVVNVVLFLMMSDDKRRAVSPKDLRRIPEKTLLGTAIIGGAIGGLLGMYLLRHKTKKPIFKITFTIALLVHIAIVVVLATYMI